MICPSCRTFVPDGTVVCPACHADLASPPERPATSLGSTFCPSCGALVPDDQGACPKCGMPMPRPSRARHATSDKGVGPVPSFLSGAAAPEAPSPDDAPRFDSAVPSRPSSAPAEERWGGVTRRRVALTAAGAAVLVMGAIALLVTRPWAGGAAPESASVDVSRAGEMEIVERLRGQDSEREAVPLVNPMVGIAEELVDIHVELGTLQGEVDVLLATFDELLAADETERAAARDTVGALGERLDGVDSRLAAIDGSDVAALANDLINLGELSSCVRSELAALTQALTIAGGYLVPSMVAGTVKAALTAQANPETGNNVYAERFWESYEAFLPSLAKELGVAG